MWLATLPFGYSSCKVVACEPLAHRTHRGVLEKFQHAVGKVVVFFKKKKTFPSSLHVPC